MEIPDIPPGSAIPESVTDSPNQVSIVSDGNLYSNFPMASPNPYGSIDEWENSWLDVSQKQIYTASVEKFYLNDSFSYAEKVNDSLTAIYNEWISTFSQTGQSMWGVTEWVNSDGSIHHPTDTVSILGITCADDQYFSILFLEKSYTLAAVFI